MRKIGRALGLFLIAILSLLLIFTLFVLSSTRFSGSLIKNSVKKVSSERILKDPNNKIEIKKNKDNYYEVFADKFTSEINMNGEKKQEENYLKILQLTDIHIGGGFLSILKDSLAISAVKELVEWSQPDIIYITGDLAFPIPIFAGTLNNRDIMQSAIKLFDSFEIPWTFVFGNHDTESFALSSKIEISELLEEHGYNPELGRYCLFQKGPVFKGRPGSDEFPMGNYPLIIRDKKTKDIVHASIFMDSNKYFSPEGEKQSFFSYDSIHQDQVAWYSKTIDYINELGNSNKVSPKKVTTSLYFHIPIPEYKISWNKMIEKSGHKRFDPNAKKEYGDNQYGIKYFGGDVQETLGVKQGVISISTADLNKLPDANDIYKAVVEKKSTYFLFCGHDHDNNFSIATEDNIRLTYSKSIDYLAYPGISKRTWQRGATLIFLTDKQEDQALRLYQKKLININNEKLNEFNTEKLIQDNVYND